MARGRNSPILMEQGGNRKSVPTIKHHAINIYSGVLAQLHAFLTLDLDGSEWSVVHSGRFNHGGKPDKLNSPVSSA
jgi:hypothetical protein